MPILNLIGLRIAAGLLISVAASADAQANAELIVMYQWGNGTVAPQYHRAGRITIRSSGDGEIEVTKGYLGTGQNESKTTFTPDPAKLKELLDYIRSNQLDSPPSSADEFPESRPRPGDGTCILSFEVRGHAYNLPCSGRVAGQLLTMIRDVVPASIAQEDQPSAPIRPPSGPDPFPGNRQADQGIRSVAIRTMDGHFLTAADGGGYGGPNEGTDAVALHSDAARAGPWEHFDWVWLDPAHTKFALRTERGTFVTAVNGGGIGGPNNSLSPFHTDARALGVDEVFRVAFEHGGKVTLRTRKGFYVTAVNGGGYGGPNSVPVHTDATSIGPWETFQVVVPPH